MAAKKFKDHSDEMEHDLHRLEEHIGDAEKQLGARRKDADPLADVAGEQDRGGGDPKGAKEDAHQAQEERSGPS